MIYAQRFSTAISTIQCPRRSSLPLFPFAEVSASASPFSFVHSFQSFLPVFYSFRRLFPCHVGPTLETFERFRKEHNGLQQGLVNVFYKVNLPLTVTEEISILQTEPYILVLNSVRLQSFVPDFSDSNTQSVAFSRVFNQPATGIIVNVPLYFHHASKESCKEKCYEVDNRRKQNKGRSWDQSSLDCCPEGQLQTRRDVSKDT